MNKTPKDNERCLNIQASHCRMGNRVERGGGGGGVAVLLLLR